MTETERFDRITEDGLCIGCGLCQSLLGENKVKVMKASNGELRPKVITPLNKEEVDLVYATCPSTRCEANPTEITSSAPHEDIVWGAYHRLALGWAANPNTRHEGSTAGVLTALACYLLHSKRVSFVLQVKPSTTEPTFGEATLSFTEADVLASVGSRYGPTAPLIDLEKALARNKPFAVIAKPCDLNALRNLAHYDKRIDSLIKYRLTMVCGGYMPDTSMDQFLERFHIDRNEVTALRYRGLGCPGPTTVTTTDGQKQDFDYIDFWGEDESQWSLPFRCKVCPDAIGEAADIVAADTWPNCEPERDVSKGDLGTNSLIMRTAVGNELVDAAVKDGYLSLGDEVEIDYFYDTQPHQVTKKKFAKARYDGLRDAGRLTPVTVGLRLEELSDLNSPSDNEKQRLGAFTRSQAKKNT